LGFYLSGHPLDSIDSLLTRFVTASISGLQEMPPKSKVAVAGLISNLKEIITKKGTRMAFANLEDTSASLELVIFPDSYAKYEPALKSDGALVISGVLEKSEGIEGTQAGLKILVDKVDRAHDLLKLAKRLTVRLDAADSSQAAIATKMALLKEVMQKHPGSTAFVLQVPIPEINKIVDLEISDPRGVEPSQQFFERVSLIIEDPKWSLQ
jgi:DNA polymerase-3 subunit alpha